MMGLPRKGWDAYESALKAIGEQRTVDPASDEVALLEELGLIDAAGGLSLTPAGSDYFTANFIRHDPASAAAIMKGLLLQWGPAAAIAQLLDGVAGASRATAESVLRSQGFGPGLTDRALGSTLALMDRFEVIDYVKSRGEVVVLERPSHADQVPASVFVSPQTPFGNRVWLRRVLEECEGHILWLDKHWTTAALEAIWEAADGHRIDRVHVLSLFLASYHVGRKVKRDYENAVKELGHRGVTLEWRTIDSRDIRDTHDRWVIGAGTARNIPNVNAIMSGQHSEMNLSEQAEDVHGLFNEYWSKARAVEENW